MAGVTPSWWQEDNLLEAKVSLALRGQQHRERWKYTRATSVIDLLDAADHVRPELPDLDLSQLLTTAPEVLLALSRTSNCMTLDPNDSDQLYGADLADATTIRVAPGSRIELIEEDAAPLRFLWIVLGPGATLTHSRYSSGNHKQWRFQHVSVGADASYHLHNHSLGAELNRQDIQVDMTGAGGLFELYASACVDRSLHLDQQITVQHLAPHATCRQQVHNIVADKAKVTFNGRIHIHANCEGSDAQLTNRNLALSGGAVINTKPELEIYTDDVRCAHGATIGRLDELQSFYCQSRGISPAAARRLLCQAFLADATRGSLAPAALEAYAGVLGS